MSKATTETPDDERTRLLSILLNPRLPLSDDEIVQLGDRLEQIAVEMAGGGAEESRKTWGRGVDISPALCHTGSRRQRTTHARARRLHMPATQKTPEGVTDCFRQARFWGALVDPAKGPADAFFYARQAATWALRHLDAHHRSVLESSDHYNERLAYYRSLESVP